MMFTKGLLLLVSTKLSVDIGDAMYSDELFTHTVDEVSLKSYFHGFNLFLIEM